MDVVLANLHLSWMGGATTYLLSVAPVLQRLGHEVTLYSPDAGATAAIARERGLRVAAGDSELPPACDAVVVQDPVLALELAERYAVPQVFVTHGAELDMASPPQLPGVTAAVVAMNDRTAARARALAVDAEVVRLRQPIDHERFCDRGPLPERPGRVLLLGNHLAGSRRDTIVEVCEAAGLTCTQIGRHGEMVSDPAGAIARADIVVGYGRSALEGMASARAVYVLDNVGGDGWVTPETYPALERDGFAGTGLDGVAGADRLRADLAAYRPEMGRANRDLVFAHHRAVDHGRDLSAVLKRVAGAPRPPLDAGRELARIVRMQWHADWQAFQLRRDVARLQAELLAARELGRAALARAEDAERRLGALTATRRWRMTQRLLRPVDRLRGR